MPKPAFDFSNYSALDVNATTTAEYTFDLPGKPSIIFAPMSDANPEILEDRLRRVVEDAENPPAPTGKMTVDTLRKQVNDDRVDDLDRLANICAVRWGTPPQTASGLMPDFNPEVVRAFLEAIPRYQLEALRGWAGNIRNFVPKAINKKAAKELGNDLQKD